MATTTYVAGTEGGDGDIRDMDKLADALNAFEPASVDVATLKINGTEVTATAAEINNVADLSERVIDLDATSLTLTEADHGERVVTLSHTDAASTVTLPAATGSGSRYHFIVAAVNTNNHIVQVANATDVFEGLALMATDNGSDVVIAFETAAGSDTITLNGTTKGGAAIGDRIDFIDYAAGKWAITAWLTGTGSEVTPFSAAVS